MTTVPKSNPGKPARRRRELVPLTDAAEHLCVSLATIRRFIASGRLPAYRIGNKALRVDLADVEALIQLVPTTDPTGGGDAA